MTMNDLREISVQDVLDSPEYRKMLNRRLHNKVFSSRNEYNMMRKLRDLRLDDADLFVPVLCEVINKVSSLPAQMRQYIYEVGMKVYCKRVRELMAMVEERQPDGED